MRDQIQKLQQQSQQQSQPQKDILVNSMSDSKQELVNGGANENKQLQRANAWISELTVQVNRLMQDLELQQQQFNPSSETDSSANNSPVDPNALRESRLMGLKAKVERARVQLSQACAWRSELERLEGAPADSNPRRLLASDPPLSKMMTRPGEPEIKHLKGRILDLEAQVEELNSQLLSASDLSAKLMLQLEHFSQVNSCHISTLKHTIHGFIQP